jgi:LacI family transcriptional regulator
VRQRAETVGWRGDDILLENGHYTVEGGRDGMRRVLARGRPDAVFAGNDLMARGALQAVREAGLSCPDDVAILGFDGIPAGEVSAPRLTTVVKPAREIGARAFQLLSARIEGRNDAEHVTLPCTLCERDSLPRARQQAARRAV